jgi:hypothetical protein
MMAYQFGSEAREQIELFVGRAEGLRRAMLAYINDTSDPRGLRCVVPRSPQARRASRAKSE